MDYKVIKTVLINTLIGFAVIGIISLVPFYYNTKGTLAQYSKNMNRLSDEVKKLSDTTKNNEKAFMVIQGETKVVNENIKNINKNYTRLETQLNKIYDILLNIKNNN